MTNGPPNNPGSSLEELMAAIGNIPPDKVAAIVQALKNEGAAHGEAIVAWGEAEIRHQVEALKRAFVRTVSQGKHILEEELQMHQALEAGKDAENLAEVPPPSEGESLPPAKMGDSTSSESTPGGISY